MKFDKVLDSKPEVTDNNGNVIKDLTAPSISSGDFFYTSLMMTTDIHIMRPDTITKTMFGIIDRVEEVLKGNNVSNPFAIDEGEIFMIPDVMSIKQNFTSIGAIADVRNKIRKQYVDASKTPDTAQFKNTINEFDQRTRTALPPNYAKEGDREMIIKDGVIYLGPNVTRVKTAPDELQSTKDYLAKLKNQ